MIGTQSHPATSQPRNLATRNFKRVIGFRTQHLRQLEPVSELDALHRRDAEERRGKLRLESVRPNIAVPCGETRRDNLDNATDGIAGRNFSIAAAARHGR